MDDKKYNGHTNWATWNIINWMSAEVYAIQDLIKEGKVTHEQGVAMLKGMIDEMNPLNKETKTFAELMYSDFLESALEDIDYEDLLEE